MRYTRLAPGRSFSRLATFPTGCRPLGKPQGVTTLINRYCPLLTGHQKLLYSLQPIE